MAAPNLVNVATILGKSAALDLTTTSATTLVSNAGASGKVFKINTLLVANDDGVNAADISIFYVSGAGTFKIGYTITVPPKAMIVVLDKNSAIYLEESCSITAQASSINDLDVICSYEELS